MPRARARAREREIVRRRDEVATAHRAHAEDRAARADYAEQQAARERAEAELHETRARMHERGLADDELDAERERLGAADADREPGGSPATARHRERDERRHGSATRAPLTARRPRRITGGRADAPAPSVAGSSAGYQESMPPKTQREREAEQRQLKLDRIRSRSTTAPSSSGR